MPRVIAPNGWPRSKNLEFECGPNGSTSNWICSSPCVNKHDRTYCGRVTSIRPVKLLRQIPAIGPIRAALLVALLQTPHRFRTKRQLWAYSGFALETHDSGEYRLVRGKLRRNRERLTVLGLNDNHNHDLKNLFKGAAISASTRPGPLYDSTSRCWRKGCGRPSSGPLSQRIDSGMPRCSIACSRARVTR